MQPVASHAYRSYYSYVEALNFAHWVATTPAGPLADAANLSTLDVKREGRRAPLAREVPSPVTNIATTAPD